MCISAVIELLADWRHTKPKTINRLGLILIKKKHHTHTHTKSPGDPHTVQLRVVCSVHCACSTDTTCNTNRRCQRPMWTKPFVCACIFFAGARHASTCTCPSCAHAQHLPACASMSESAWCLRVFSMLVFLAHTCGHVSVYGLLGGRAHALLRMWVHAYFYCAIYKKCSNTPRALFLRPLPLWGDSPPSIMSARRRNLRLACGSAELVFLRAHRYLHHGPPRPHTRPRTNTTPLHATTLHSHLLPAHTVVPHSHLYLGYK